MAAAAAGQLEAVRLLLARGAAVDAVRPVSGYAALHVACRKNHSECVEALARAGCDVGLKGFDGETGRQVAEREGSSVMMTSLVPPYSLNTTY